MLLGFANFPLGSIRCFVIGAACSSLVFTGISILFFTSTCRNFGSSSSPTKSDLSTHSSRTDGKPVKVLIAGYWRSGSGFLGELFNQNSNAFYLVEPLNGYIYSPMLANDVDETGNPIEKNHYSVNDFFDSFTDRSPSQRANLLKQVFSCDFKNIPAGVLLHRVMKLSRSSYQFNFCLQWNGANLEKCRPVLSSACRELQLTAVKEVYARAATIKQLMTAIPDLNVIHLIRDARGIVLSQRDRKMIGHGETLEEAAGRICSMIVNDVQALSNSTQFRDRLLTLHYEDIAEHPLESTKKVYEFLRISLPENVANWIASGTASKENHSHAGWLSSTRKRNSTATAYAWKHRLRPEEISVIDRACKAAEFYNVLGFKYSPISSEAQLL